MIKSFIFSILLLSCLSLSGQTTTQLDSLLRKLDTQKEDTNKLNSLIKIQNLFTEKQGDKKLAYMEQALQLAKKLNQPAKQAQIYLDFGTYYTFRSDFEKSLKYHLECAKVGEQMNLPNYQIKGYLGVGQAFQRLDKHSPKARAYFKKAENVAISTKESSMLSNIYLQFAFNFYYENKFDSTLFYHFKALELAKKKQDFKLIANIYNEIGLTYSQQKKTDLALKNFDLAIDIYQKLQKKPNIELGYVYSDIGSTYTQLKNYKKALEAFKLSLAYTKEAKNVETEMEDYLYMSDLYGEIKDYKLQSQFLKKYYSIRDSLFDNDNKLQLVELENDYQLEKKNALIAKQEAETIKSINQRNIFIAIAISTLLLAVVLGLFYRRIQKKNTQISQQKEELQQLNQVKDRLFAVLSHDLRNPLVTLKTYFLMLSNSNISAEKKEKYTTQTLKSVNYTSDLLDNLLAWANSQLKNNTVKFSNINLEESIDDVIALIKPQAEQKQVEIEKKIQVSSTQTNQLILETILRNLITNAVKFSYEGGKVLVSTEEKNNHLSISVSDEGIGMNQEKIQAILQSDVSKSIGTSGEKGSGIGLVLVKELTKQINAELIIESQEGLGSVFKIKL